MKKLTVLIYLLVIGLFSCERTPTSIDYDWKDVSLENNLEIASIHMLDDETGYVAGDANSGIINSSSHQSFPFGDTLIYEAGNGLFYNIIEIEDGKFPEPVLYKTTNGGESWQAIETPFKTGVMDMQFINENIGYITAYDDGVYKTIDGGQNWIKLLENIMHTIHGDNYTNPFTYVCFIDENKGFLYSDDINGTALFSTRDGGQSWKCISIEYAPNMVGKHPTLFTRLEKLIFFNNSDTGYAVDNSELYKTTDMGETWELIHDLGSNDPSTVYFTSSQTGYLTALQLVTIDGGITWSHDDFKLHGNNLVLIDEKEFYYTDYERIIKKYVGERERHFMTMETDTYIYDLFFPSEKVGYAIGAESTILKHVRIP